MRRPIIWLIAIAFWFNGNTLYWIDTQNPTKNRDYYWLQLQLDNNIPPKVNENPIDTISITKNIVSIYSKNKCWTLHYTQNPEGIDWCIEEWYYCGLH